MSNSVLTLPPGLKYDQQKTPVFSTRVQRAASGRELRAALMVYPLFLYTLSIELLRDNPTNHELSDLLGFYLSRQGAFDSFLYIDLSDQTVAAQAIATGNGNTKTFQMVSTYGGFVIPRYDIQAAGSPTPILKIYLAGVNQTSGWTMGYTTGILTFTSAPGNGVAITADFSFYNRVRFIEYTDGDYSDSFNEFMYNLWDLKRLQFVTAR